MLLAVWEGLVHLVAQGMVDLDKLELLLEGPHLQIVALVAGGPDVLLMAVHAEVPQEGM
jgi:hypothetical protein